MDSNNKSADTVTRRNGISPQLENSKIIANGENGISRDEESVKKMGKSKVVIPESLDHLLVGLTESADCVRPWDEKPDWLDMDKLRRGQKFAQDYKFATFYGILVALLAAYNYEDGLKPLIFTGKSATLYTSFTRYLSTLLRLRRWFTQDPWDKNTEAAKDVLYARSVHAAARRNLNAHTVEELKPKLEVPNAWCPGRDIMLKDFSEQFDTPEILEYAYTTIKNNRGITKNISQTEMAVTQWGFFALLVCYPKSFGIYYATDEDLEGYCHLWRSIGYQMGISDEYNFARGTLKEIRQRNQELIDTWLKPNFMMISPEWEHMCRCFIASMSTLCPFYSFDAMILHVTEIMNIKMPRLYTSLSFIDWLRCLFLRIVLKYVARLPFVHATFNFFQERVLNRAEKYTAKDFEAIEVKFSEWEKIIAGAKNHLANGAS